MKNFDRILIEQVTFFIMIAFIMSLLFYFFDKKAHRVDGHQVFIEHEYKGHVYLMEKSEKYFIHADFCACKGGGRCG